MNTNNSPYQPEERTNPRVYFTLFFKAWKWYALSFLISLILGFAYLRYSTAIYTSQSTILIIEDDENILLVQEAVDHQDKYSLARKTEAEAVILKSRFLLEKVAEKQRLNIQLLSLTGRTEFKQTEAYEDPAFTVVQSNNVDSLLYSVNLEFIIRPINSESFELTVEDESPTIYGINDAFKINKVHLQLVPNSNYKMHWLNYKYKVVITPMDQVVTDLQSRISIDDEKLEVGVLGISLDGPTPQKNDDIIDGLIEVYQAKSILEKNKVANSTNLFIDERLKLLKRELSSIESNGETLKKQNDVLDIDITYSSILMKQNELDKHIVNAEVQLQVVKYVQDYINEKGNKLVPMNLGLVNTPLVKTITAYNTLYNELTELKETTGDRNPRVLNIEKELTSSKINLQKSMKSLILSQELRLEELNAQYAIGEQKIALLPGFERQERNINRHKQIIESIYLYLLQKKEENEIILASTIADCRVIDKAFSNPTPISPNKRIVYVLILVMSLLPPSLGLYLKTLFNNKVLTPNKFESYGIPLIGTIENNKGKVPRYSKNLGDPISESFRKLRVLLNLQCDVDQTYCNTLLITSMKAREGKTFTALNLARSLADIDNKVVVIDVDLQSHGLADHVKINPITQGVSNFVSELELRFEDVLIHSSEFENLSFITSGPTPPNPSEMLTKPRLQELITRAKAENDYVIIDSGSLDTSIDNYLLVPLVDMTLLVCKTGVLRTEELKTIQSYSHSNRLGNIQVIFNNYTKSLTSKSYQTWSKPLKWYVRLLNTLKNKFKRK